MATILAVAIGRCLEECLRLFHLLKKGCILATCQVLPWRMLPNSWHRYLGGGYPSPLIVKPEKLAEKVKQMFGTKVVAVNYDFGMACDAIKTLWPHNAAAASSNFACVTCDAARDAISICAKQNITWIVHDRDAVVKLIESGTPFLVVIHNSTTNIFKSPINAAKFLQNALGSKHYVILLNGRQSNGVSREKQLKAMAKLGDIDQSHLEEIRSMLNSPQLLPNPIPGLLLDGYLSSTIRIAHTFCNGATWSVLLSPTIDDLSEILPRCYRSSAGSAFFLMSMGPSSPLGEPLLHGQPMSVSEILTCLACSRSKSLPDVILVLASARSIVQAARVCRSIGPERDPRWVLRNNLDNTFGIRHPFYVSWNAVLSSDDSKFNLAANRLFESPTKQNVVQSMAPSAHAAHCTQALTKLFLLYFRLGWHVMWRQPTSEGIPSAHHIMKSERQLVKQRQTVPLFFWPLGLGDDDPLDNILTDC